MVGECEMAIFSILLNKTVTIKRTSQVFNDIGDVKNELTTVATDVKCRITRNKFIGQDTFNEAGRISAATHRIFFNTGVDVKTGDYVYDGTDEYWVDNANTIPGGATDHHIECECVKTNK